MKKILILLLLFTTISADDKKQKVTIGIGPYIQTQPYKDVKNIVLPSPVIFFDNSIFYIRWSRAGVYFLGAKHKDYSWGFSITGQPRPYGYKASDSTKLEGMSEKKTSIEAGFAFSATLHDAYIESMVLTDILQRHNSWIAKTELGYDFSIGDFKFYPSLIVIYQSSDFINYYYGVSSTEATPSRPQYSANSDLQLGMQTYIKYPFTDNLSALINLRVDKLSSEVTSSPIVSDNYIYSGLASLIYTFEY